MGYGKHSSRPEKKNRKKRNIENIENVETESIDIYSSSKGKRKGFDIFLRVLLVIECLAMLIGVIYVISTGLLPTLYIIGLIVFVILIGVLQAFLKLKPSKKNRRRIVSIILTVIILSVDIFAISMLGAFNSSVGMLSEDEDATLSPNAANVAKESFIIYLSGSDTRNYDNIPEKGLSDVNMVIAVNPLTHKILMVNTPRDYYVGLWGDQNKLDKLTHAGSYGIDCSMQTLENLFDIKFNYYAKINFKSVVDIVDALGGVTVNSEIAFSSSYSLSKKRYSFVVGENQLTGDAALAFARERKSLKDGDRQRGKNQQLVIKAMVDKVISPSLLNPSKFKEILSSVTKNTKTNFANKEITALFKAQLKDMKGWDIESISVDGTGASRRTYSYPSQNLYVMIPNEETVESAKTALAEIMNQTKETKNTESSESVESK